MLGAGRQLINFHRFLARKSQRGCALVMANATMQTSRRKATVIRRSVSMGSGKDLHTAIERRDSATLRKMAQTAQKETTRMFLNLLADFLDQDDLKKLRKTA